MIDESSNNSLAFHKKDYGECGFNHTKMSLRKHLVEHNGIEQNPLVKCDDQEFAQAVTQVHHHLLATEMQHLRQGHHCYVAY